MISSGYYRLTFKEATIGVDQYVYLYPDQTVYTYVLQTTATAEIPFSGDYINSTLTATPMGATVSLNMTYVDLSATTNALTFFVRFSNKTVAYSHLYTSQNVVNTSYSVSNIAGDAYVWGYEANNTRFGWQNQSSGITLKGVTGIVYNPFEYKGHW